MLSVPGKVFLLGEYAVLTDEPAWVSAVSPRFSFTPGIGEVGFHPESPAASFLLSRGASVNGVFFDPWEGRGGFGGSTAEFAVVAYEAGIRDALDAWSAYRALSEKVSPWKRPSGADLLAQWVGGTVEWDPKTRTITRLDSDLSGLPLLIFSATHLPNRKTVTHFHLETLGGATTSFASLSPAFERAKAGASEKNWAEVGHAFSAFADALAHLNLESPVVRNERLALSRLPGVLGVKGCGSLQTDAMLVVVESLSGPKTEAVIEFAQETCGLKLLSRGLPLEPGIREER